MTTLKLGDNYQLTNRERVRAQTAREAAEVARTAAEQARDVTQAAAGVEYADAAAALAGAVNGARFTYWDADDIVFAKKEAGVVVDLPGPWLGGERIGNPIGGTLGDEVAARMGERNATNLAAVAALPDGTVVEVAGLKYEVDSLLTGADSAGDDEGVDGLKPHGDWSPEHFGSKTNFAADATGRVIKGRGVGLTTIHNTANVPILSVVGNGPEFGNRFDQVRFEDMRIRHDGAHTEPAVKVEESAFNVISNVYAEALNGALNGARIGHASGATLTIQAYENFLFNVTMRGFETNYRVQSAGSGVTLLNCFSYAVEGGTARCDAIFSTANTRIIAGQYKHIYMNNVLGARDNQFSIEHLSMEACAAGDYLIKVGGASPFAKGFVYNVLFNGAVVAGVGVDLDQAWWTEVVIRAKNPTSWASGGVLFNLGANARENTIYLDQDSAKSPFSANSAALRNVRVVTGEVTRADAASYPVSPYLRTVLPYGVDQVPTSWLPANASNGETSPTGVWNYQLLTLADDTATSFLPPRKSGILRIMTGGDASCTAIIAYKCDSVTPACVLMCGAGDVEVGTGALTGLTGTNNKVRVSAHTDGKIYVEQRKGSNNTRCTVMMTGNAWV